MTETKVALLVLGTPVIVCAWFLLSELAAVARHRSRIRELEGMNHLARKALWEYRQGNYDEAARLTAIGKARYREFWERVGGINN